MQIQALSVALSRPIYSYFKFNSDSNRNSMHFIPSNISLQELIDRFNKKTAGGHLIYLGYESDRNKIGLCVYYTGTHYDALLPCQDNPPQLVPHFDLINMSL